MPQLQPAYVEYGAAHRRDGGSVADSTGIDPARVAAVAELDRLAAHVADVAQQLRRFIAIAAEEPVAAGEAAHSLHRAGVALNEARTALTSPSGASRSACTDPWLPEPRR